MPFLTVLAGEDVPAARRPQANWRPTGKKPIMSVRELWGKLFKAPGRTRAPMASPRVPTTAAQRPSSLSTLGGAAQIAQAITRRGR